VADIIPITDVSDTTGSVNGTTKKVTVANLVAAAPQGDLVASNNLSDVASTGTARTNLGLGTAATTASSDYATAAHTHAIDDLSDVDTSTVAPTTNDFLKWSGSNWVPAVPAADVDTPLNTALRGTTNPHIGAYPNQSFKVIDNPYKSVMVVADEAGNLKLLNSLGVNNIAVGFSVVEDGVEPDIEVVSGSETYSVISGDSDTKGANGLPLRQGFNLPDIGANPAPTLISGGTIA
jgi:hypothetical protein